MITVMDLIKDGQPASVIEAKLEDIKGKICDEYCKHSDEDCEASYCPLDEI